MTSYSDLAGVNPAEARFGLPDPREAVRSSEPDFVTAPAPPPPPPPPVESTRLFAFVTLNQLQGGVPRVLDFPNNPEGFEMLVKVARGETLLAAVEGRVLSVDARSEVVVRKDDGTVAHDSISNPARKRG